jgi:hypothetical protein
MFKLIYWLPNQSTIFGVPQYYETNNRADFIVALTIAEENGYVIEFATEI